MSYKLQLTRKAQKYFQRLDPPARERILTSFRELLAYYDQSAASVAPDVKALQGKFRGLFRLRVGDLRIIFRPEIERLVILVIEIIPRGDAYK